MTKSLDIGTGPLPVEVFSTCPQSKDMPQEEYLQRVIDVAQWSEAFGCAGILVYTDNGIVDPWHVSQVILENTKTLAPLVAIQPIYMHPYFVAKKIATLSWLYRRRIALNMLAGGFKNDLIALGDDTPHDDRYRRTVEYTKIIRDLVEKGMATLEGRYYKVTNLKLVPPVPPELQPQVLASGSSPAGMEAARDMGAVAVKYPKPPGEEEDVRDGHAPGYGVRVGVIARKTADEAWAVAHERFPEDRRGQLTQQLAMKVSDSSWHKQLSQRLDGTPDQNPYWLGPFQNYKTFCPYLVGNYDVVADLVRGYIASGYKTFILDIPASRDELEHIGIVFRKAGVPA
ncbi:MAG: LLM class flavin-dependent oxidoreductase [Planctomycetota bacterium]